MEEFNIKVLQNHFNVIIDNYKSKLRDNQMPYDYSREDLIIDLHRLEMTEKKIYLHQLEPYQLAFFDIVKANEKYLRGVKKSSIINIQGERKRFCYQNENFAVLILIALSNKIDEIERNKQGDIKDTTKSIKGKGGRPKAQFKPLQNYIFENPVYKSPKEISTILIEQFKNSKAADLKTMIEGLKRLNIWNKSDNKEIVLMLKKDFNYKESTENYRKAKSKKVDEVKIQIKKLITK